MPFLGVPRLFLTAHECVFKMELADVRAREWKRAGIDGDRGQNVVVLVSNDRFLMPGGRGGTGDLEFARSM